MLRNICVCSHFLSYTSHTVEDPITEETGIPLGLYGLREDPMFVFMLSPTTPEQFLLQPFYRSATRCPRRTTNPPSSPVSILHLDAFSSTWGCDCAYSSVNSVWSVAPGYEMPPAVFPCWSEAAVGLWAWTQIHHCWSWMKLTDIWKNVCETLRELLPKGQQLQRGLGTTTKTKSQGHNTAGCESACPRECFYCD